MLKFFYSILFLSLLMLHPTLSYAQGMSMRQGRATQQSSVEFITLSGQLLEAIEEQDLRATARTMMVMKRMSMMLLLKTPDGEIVSVHLGPATTLKKYVLVPGLGLKEGQQIEIEAIRTPMLTEGHYIAKSLKYNNRTVQLRDDSLRPIWSVRGMQKKSPRRY